MSKKNSIATDVRATDLYTLHPSYSTSKLLPDIMPKYDIMGFTQ